MPPTRPVARPPPPSPTLEPFPPLSDKEEELLDIAIRLTCALREFEARDGNVDHSHFTASILQELVGRYVIGVMETHVFCRVMQRGCMAQATPVTIQSFNILVAR